MAPGIAPGQYTLGFMLPYTPLHHLLMENLPGPIVLTSGNRSDEPRRLDLPHRLDRPGDLAHVHLTPS